LLRIKETGLQVVRVWLYWAKVNPHPRVWTWVDYDTVFDLAEKNGVRVLAHELGHVRNRDILTSAVVATLAGAITLLARMAWWAEMFGFGGGGRDDDRGGAISAIAMMILAPVAALLIQLAISRSREYEADAGVRPQLWLRGEHCHQVRDE
jgi:hypothetical protein